MIHELKTIQPFFDDVASGKKRFEVRKKDRDFKVGDYLALNEYIPAKVTNVPIHIVSGNKYTGRCMIVEISYVLDDEKFCKQGYVVLGLVSCGIYSENNNITRLPSVQAVPVYEIER